jgi:hypothetical protein
MDAGHQNPLENAAPVKYDIFVWLHGDLLESEQCTGALPEQHEKPRPSANNRKHNQNAYKYSPCVSQASAPPSRPSNTVADERGIRCRLYSTAKTAGHAFV